MKLGLFLLFLCLVVAACNKPKPLENPGAVDPTLADLAKERNSSQAEANSLAAEMEKLKVDLEKVKVRSGKDEFIRETLFELQGKRQKAIERYRYYSIKFEERRKEINKIYPTYFEKGLPWPDPAHYEAYQQLKTQLKGSREWSAERRVRQYKKAREPAAAPAAPSGHH